MGYTARNVPYIVFEFLEGALLTDEIYRVGGLPVRRAVRIAAQIASALGAAHASGIIHRDLKSDNVFLTDKDDTLDTSRCSTSASAGSSPTTGRVAGSSWAPRSSWRPSRSPRRPPSTSAPTSTRSA